MSIHLSKSKYCQAVQCPKMLWLRTNKPEVFDESVMNESVLASGNEVGDLAMGLFGEFKEIPFKADDFGSMIRLTKELLEQGTPIITEATFAYQGLLCMVDILKNFGNNTVELYEVKSSSEMKPVYYEDTAFQRYVLTMAGYEVRRVCLVHLNKQYVRHGELDLSELFHIEDVTAEAAAAHDVVDANIKRFEKYMQQKEEPSDDIGEHCFESYGCGFWKYCTQNFPQPNVFDVAGMQQRTKWKHFRQGLVSFRDLKANASLKKKPAIQVDTELTGKAYIDKTAIREFLSTLSYPLYFLDFETINPAIPPYDNTKPHAQIPFQYSLHYIEKPDDVLQHKEFLAEPGKDPRRALAEHLCADIPLDVCTVAYNMRFEKGVIEELAKLFPDLSTHLMNIYDHIKDIMIPFDQKDYYVKEMQGSYSIKYVLPALFPDDPSLNYGNLEDVHNGGEASTAFVRMDSLPPQEQEKLRENLLKYCGLDTLAMVKVWEKLNEVAEGV